MIKTDKPLTHISHLTLRRNLGLLGLSLPLLVYLMNGFTLLPSISHYYYSQSNVMFIGVLFSFGLFLFSYRGYPINKEKKEWISDNWLSNIAGIMVTLVAFIPTSKTCPFPLLDAPNQHTNTVFAGIHIFCAAGFFIIMAWMSWFKFTQSDLQFENLKHKRLKQRRNIIYKVAAIGVITSLVFMYLFGFVLTEYASAFTIYIGETFALFFFGTAWLVKSKALRGIGL